MKAKFPLSILVLVLVTDTPEPGYAVEPVEPVDYSPILERIGIRNEPSILDQCDVGSSAIRVTGLAGGKPFVVFRLVVGESGRRLIKRLIENGNPKASVEYSVSDSDWVALVDRLQHSGFWTYERDESYWMPDGHQQWIEACIDGKFRSIAIYPDRDTRMSEFTNFLVRLTT